MTLVPLPLCSGVELLQHTLEESVANYEIMSGGFVWLTGI
jgi:hypothetical protein